MNTSSYIVSINTGSSSIKVTAALAEDPSVAHSATIHAPRDYNEALTQAFAEIQALSPAFSEDAIQAFGHRIVHGGTQPEPARLVDDAVLEELRTFAAFDPEHAPAALKVLTALRQKYPSIPQVACFDTAFFHDIPRVAQMTSLPRRFEAMGLRRYGFHGLSYSFLLQEVTRSFPESAREKIIFAHLGSGSSLAAVQNGKPLEMTMGFSPTSGVIMSSRSGDIDPSIVGFLARHGVATPEAWMHIVNHESGLLGVSGISADMATLLGEEATSEPAHEAVELFVYQVRKAIGQLSAVLGGVDRIVFSGGIGEKSAILRRRIMEGFEYLGFTLDEEANRRHVSSAAPDGIISSSDSKPIHVMITNENAIIIEQTRRLTKA